MNHRTANVLAAASLLLLASNVGAQSPFAVKQETRTTPDGPVQLFIATIDLTDPTLDIVVTDPLPNTLAADTKPPAALSVEAELQPTDQWAKAMGTQLALNANFFARSKGSLDSDVIGLSVSNGRVISPLRAFEQPQDPVLAFGKDRKARIECLSEEGLPGIWDAVSGVGPSGGTVNSLLVLDGVNQGSSARVEPTKRHPRTAVGVSKSGWKLYVVVVDGRQPEYSVGMTLVELADVLIELGADDALNLDGGGSSAFVYTPADGTTLANRPSDGEFRAVANHLGFRVITPTATPQAAPSPVAPGESKSPE